MIPWLFILFALFAGPVAEIILMQFNSTWRYISPDLLGIPVWLFPLWAIASITIVTVYLAILRYKL